MTDVDLVFKLQSLPPEDLDELLSLLGESEAAEPIVAKDKVLKRLSEPMSGAGTRISR